MWVKPTDAPRFAEPPAPPALLVAGCKDTDWGASHVVLSFDLVWGANGPGAVLAALDGTGARTRAKLPGVAAVEASTWISACWIAPCVCCCPLPRRSAQRHKPHRANTQSPSHGRQHRGKPALSRACSHSHHYTKPHNTQHTIVRRIAIPSDLQLPPKRENREKNCNHNGNARRAAANPHQHVSCNHAYWW